MSDTAKNLDYRQSERSALSTGSLRAKTYVFILPGYIVSTCIHQQRLHKREGGSENTFNLPCPSESFENPFSSTPSNKRLKPFSMFIFTIFRFPLPITVILPVEEGPN